RLVGPRFDGSIPVEVLGEFGAYREIIVELAKELYRRTKSRKHVPKHFADQFQLHLAGSIEEGSAIATLARPFVEGSAGLAPPSPDEFDEARDYLNEALEEFESTGSLPSDFPGNVIPLFGAFGKRLNDDE